MARKKEKKIKRGIKIGSVSGQLQKVKDIEQDAT